jgi:hypothetical protein
MNKNQIFQKNNRRRKIHYVTCIEKHTVTMTNKYVRSMVSAAETVCESATLNIAASPGQNIKGINITSTGGMNNIPVSAMYHIVV